MTSNYYYMNEIIHNCRVIANYSKTVDFRKFGFYFQNRHKRIKKEIEKKGNLIEVSQTCSNNNSHIISHTILN